LGFHMNKPQPTPRLREWVFKLPLFKENFEEISVGRMENGVHSNLDETTSSLNIHQREVRGGIHEGSDGGVSQISENLKGEPEESRSRAGKKVRKGLSGR